MMAAKDLFHNVVKQALIKEKWVITADLLMIKIEGVKLEIDLAAEKVIAAEKEREKILYWVYIHHTSDLSLVMVLLNLMRYESR